MCPVFKSFGVVPLLSMFLQMICRGNAMEFLVFWRRIAGNPSGPGADEGDSVPISLMNSSYIHLIFQHDIEYVNLKSYASTLRMRSISYIN